MVIPSVKSKSTWSISNENNNPVNGNQETISTPDKPGGPGTGQPRESLTYYAGGASSNLGHDIQYRFDWGDGNYSAWLFSRSLDLSSR